MTDWQRLESVIKYVGLTTNAFAKSIGYSRAELLYRIERGENGISKKLASDITIKYCNISESYLLTGEGEMLRTGDKNEVNESPQQPYACRECKKKDEEIKKWRDKYDDMTAKYLAVLEEIKDKKVS